MGWLLYADQVIVTCCNQHPNSGPEKVGMAKNSQDDKDEDPSKV